MCSEERISEKKEVKSRWRIQRSLNGDSSDPQSHTTEHTPQTAEHGQQKTENTQRRNNTERRQEQSNTEKDRLYYRGIKDWQGKVYIFSRRSVNWRAGCGVFAARERYTESQIQEYSVPGDRKTDRKKDRVQSTNRKVSLILILFWWRVSVAFDIPLLAIPSISSIPDTLYTLISSVP